MLITLWLKELTKIRRIRIHEHRLSSLSLLPHKNRSLLIKSTRDSVRKAREAYLIERGKTLEPLGMNKKDEMYYSFYFFYLLTFIYTFFYISVSNIFQSLLQRFLFSTFTLFFFLNYSIIVHAIL